jgi:hypothetical protein
VAQEGPKIVNLKQKDSPPPINFEEKYKLQTMRIAAHEILSRLKDARVKRHQATAEENLAQGEFDLQNFKINLEVARLVAKYDAAGWEFGPDLNWIKKKEKVK